MNKIRPIKTQSDNNVKPRKKKDFESTKKIDNKPDQTSWLKMHRNK